MLPLILDKLYTVEPLRRGHFGESTIVFLLGGCPYLRGQPIVPGSYHFALKVQCVYHLHSPKLYGDKMREVLNSLSSPGLIVHDY